MTAIEEVLIALRRVMRATGLHSKFLARTTGLTTPQILVLQAIRSSPGELIVGELAARVNLSQATVTSILDRLEKRQLVSRQRSLQDKRKVVVSLTGPGLKTLKSAPMPLQEQFTRQFHELQEWEQSMIVAALQRVAMMMDADEIDASPVLDVGLLMSPETHEDEPAEPVPSAAGNH
ncbi:MAG: MarR family transcriptional regulator [Pseudomonadales bacterium]|nr:MarR family transcriptional regulator [Pseudomonadales bacterium]